MAADAIAAAQVAGAGDRPGTARPAEGGSASASLPADHREAVPDPRSRSQVAASDRLGRIADPALSLRATIRRGFLRPWPCGSGPRRERRCGRDLPDSGSTQVAVGAQSGARRSRAGRAPVAPTGSRSQRRARRPGAHPGRRVRARRQTQAGTEEGQKAPAGGPGRRAGEHPARDGRTEGRGPASAQEP